MPNLLIHLLLALRNRANIALLTLTALMAILAPTPASAQTTPTFGTATVPDTTYTVNVAVSDTLPAAGTGALTYTLTPALPAGLTYKAATSGHGGILAGVPTTAASATTYTLTATDASNATATLTFTLSVTAIVTIPDDSLRAVIESSLGKSAGETITNVDMSRLTRLVAPSKGITDLTGLAFATNLTDLRLHNNKIRDISALSGLTSLRTLRLQRNRISDLEPLVRNTGWSRGAFVNVQGNPLSAASRTTHIPTLTGIDRGVTVEFDRLTLRPVTIADDSLRAVIEDRLDLSIAAGDTITNADMLGLFQLVAPNKGIRDLTGLAFATNLDTLDLRNNNITAIDSLSGLINLASLGLRNNLISDLEPLTLNTGLGRGDHVDVRGNPLSAASRTTHIPNLTRRRVSVTFDSRSWAPLELVSGDGQTGRAGEVLRDSFVVQVRSATDTTYAYRHLPVTFSVAAGGGRLSTTSDTTDSNGLASTLLRLGTTGMDTVKAFVEGVNDTLIFSTVPIRVTIPDTSLRKVIESSLGKARNAPITEVEMLGLTQLTATGHAITDLTGLEFATNLSRLGLRGNTITAIDSLAGLTNLSNLDLRSNTITDISPLAGLTNVDTLLLHENTITDISPLAGLTNLSFLWLYNNTITDISPLAGLDSLSSLSLSGNTIADISPLAGLDSLSILYLSNNRISDLSPLTSNTGLGSGDLVDVRDNPLNRPSLTMHIDTLTSRGVSVSFDPRSVTISDDSLRAVVLDSLDKTNRDTIWSSDMSGMTRLYAPNKGIRDLTGLEFATTLDTLDLSNNNITAIDSLSGLTNLSRLYLRDNRISDLSPLTSNTGLGSGDLVDVRGNPLSAASRTTYIPTLTSSSRGVTVLFDNLTEARLRLVSGDGQTGIASTPLALPFVVKVRRAIVQNATDTMHVYRNLPVSFSVAAGGGRLSATSDTTDSNGLARTLLTLGATVGMDTVKAFVEGASDTLLFTTVPIRPVTIPDAHLRAEIEGSLGKSAGATITNVDMLRLTGIYWNKGGISDLTGLEFATNLSELDLGNNNITDISPLSGLTNLLGLNLADNDITDISPLSGLTKLTGLDLGNNNIRDISPLSGLDSLSTLSLGYNNIRDISPLSGLTNLSALSLVYNNITDISPLSGLDSLSTLSLGYNNIRDISPLSGLTNLSRLWLYEKNITDISHLSGLTNLSLLGLRGTNITDISHLSGLTNLSILGLENTNITDISPLSGLTNLSWLGLENTNITDISHLSGLTNLSTLYLRNNNIMDISPLSGLTNLSRLWLNGNPLSAASRTTHIPALTSRGVRVWFDPLSAVRLIKVSGDGQTGRAGAALADPFVVKVQSKNSAGQYINLPVTFSVTAGGGTLSATSDTTDSNGLARILLTLGTTVGMDTVKAFVEGASDTLIFTTMSPRSVTIADANLRAVIEDSLNKESGTAINNAEMLRLTRLDAPNKGISNLTGLEFATQLDTLDLSNNRISNIDSLAGLTRLKKLSLGGNRIADIDSLARLTDLTWLWLSYNAIADIASLANLTDLTWLGLGDNRISNIASLADLTHLTRLGLSNNRIADLSPLTLNTGLGSGDHVDVRGNPLSTASRTTHIDTLTSSRRGVTVRYDSLTVARLVKFSGDGQIGKVNTALANPFVVKVEDQNRRGYAGLPVTFSVTAGGGSLSALTDTTDATGQAETILTLGPTASTHTCLVSVAGLSQTLTFTATLPTPDFDGNGRVNFADFMALANKIRSVQGRGSYEVKYDLDGDGVIGMGDFRILTSRFGDGKFDDAK